MPGLYVETLGYAARLVGGYEELSLRLEVTEQELLGWLSGHGKPPIAAFRKAVDIIADQVVGRLSRAERCS